MKIRIKIGNVVYEGEGKCPHCGFNYTHPSRKGILKSLLETHIRMYGTMEVQGITFQCRYSPSTITTVYFYRDEK